MIDTRNQSRTEWPHLRCLFFYDPREERFVANSRSLGDALVQVGFTIRRLPAINITTKVMSELKIANQSGFARLFFAFLGHGGFTSVPGRGTAKDVKLSLQGGLHDLNGKFASVTWLTHAAAEAFPSPNNPKIFLLDCCFSDAGDRAVDAPADFDINAASNTQPEDYIVLRAAGAGFLGYMGSGSGYAATLASNIKQHQGNPDYDIEALHSLTVQHLGKSEFYGSHMSPNIAHNHLRKKLYLSPPQYNHDKASEGPIIAAAKAGDATALERALTKRHSTGEQDEVSFMRTVGLFFTT